MKGCRKMISGPVGRFVGLRGPFCVLWCYLPSWFAGCLAEWAEKFHPLWGVVKLDGVVKAC